MGDRDDSHRHNFAINLGPAIGYRAGRYAALVTLDLDLFGSEFD